MTHNIAQGTLILEAVLTGRGIRNISNLSRKAKGKYFERICHEVARNSSRT